MKFILIRHGQTDLNKQKRIMGRIDQPLNTEGSSQAKAVLPKLKDVEFDVLFSSPLLRAKQTAEVIAEHYKIDINFYDEIVERDFGSLAEKTWDEAIKISGVVDLIEKDVQQEYNYRPYGGESVEDVKKRLLNFIKEVKEKYPNNVALVVAHSGILRLMHHLFKKGEVTKIKNASIHEFEL